MVDLLTCHSCQVDVGVDREVVVASEMVVSVVVKNNVVKAYLQLKYLSTIATTLL